jgi:GH24 family phage-related lysozyme (muramidase)
MNLRLNSNGDSVKQLQRDLNKLGSILLVDGDFGLGTRSAVIAARATVAPTGPVTVGDPGVADDALQGMLNVTRDPFPVVKAPGATFIARLEVGSPRQYELMYRHPAWPGEQSGITIGIGYDLKFVTRLQFEADWAGVLSPTAIDRLAVAFSVTGRTQLRQAVADLDFPLDVAMKVFRERTLPEFIIKTRSIYPQLDSLSPARATALVSLVYNRGASLDGDRRREMRAIQTLLASDDLDAVAAEFDAMERLWEPTCGLVKRRHDEARLWRSGFAALQLD